MEVPIQTLHLFLPLDQKLIELQKSLSHDEWNKQTVATKWTVKDVAAHLLDRNMRTLSGNGVIFHFIIGETKIQSIL